MTNAEWILHEGWKFSDLSVRVFDMDDIDIYHNAFVIDRYHTAGCRPVNALLQWLEAQHKEKILTDKEKEYLAAVIKPFKEDVICIEKNDYDIWDGIRIVVRRGSDFNIIALPTFHKGTMYKGMELNRKYKVEELSL